MSFNGQQLFSAFLLFFRHFRGSVMCSTCTHTFCVKSACNSGCLRNLGDACKNKILVFGWGKSLRIKSQRKLRADVITFQTKWARAHTHWDKIRNEKMRKFTAGGEKRRFLLSTDRVRSNRGPFVTQQTTIWNENLKSPAKKNSI